MKLSKLTINLLVVDIDETIAFYEQYFHAKMLAKVPEQGLVDFAMVQIDTVTLMFQTVRSATAETKVYEGVTLGGSFMIYLDVDDAKQWYDKLNGVLPIVHELHNTFYNTCEFTVQDINGYIITFAQDL